MWAGLACFTISTRMDRVPMKAPRSPDALLEVANGPVYVVGFPAEQLPTMMRLLAEERLQRAADSGSRAARK